jgi:predicted rRNA methylase YqxC with S4 and FtsJ domains
MNRNKDAYGQEVLAYLEGKPSYEIVERDDGFVVPGGAINYFGEYKDWPRWQKQAIKSAKGKVLDIGAGAGGFLSTSRNAATE